jgi:uncharacterized protein YprB with RNaseH-like and TPR domain/prefoldin subunit 5
MATNVSLGRELVRQFKGKSLEEAIGAKMISNEYGECYLIIDDFITEFRREDFNNLAEFCKNEDLAIIDIETLGITFERPIILLGIANIMKNEAYTNQFLLRDFSDELAAIWSFLSHIKGSSTLITYNGRKFDIPYIKQRLSLHSKEFSFNNHHFDILHFVYRTLGGSLPNYRLETVERYFGIQRGLDISGLLVPHFYETYLKTRNVGPLIAILKHNKQDLINLGLIVSRLHDLRSRRNIKESLGFAQEKQVTDAYRYSHLRPPKPLSVNYPREYFLKLLNLKSKYRISSSSVRARFKGTQYWWERPAKTPYKCSVCNGIIDSGERYIGRKKLIPGKRGPYGHRGRYVTDFYHIFCLVTKERDDIEKEIEKVEAEINGIEHEIAALRLKIVETRKRIDICADEKCGAKKSYETARWWRKLDQWLSSQFKSLAKNREIARLNREIIIAENQEIPERRVKISNLRTQIKELTARLKEIENNIHELISADITRKNVKEV